MLLFEFHHHQWWKPGYSKEQPHGFDYEQGSLSLSSIKNLMKKILQMKKEKRKKAWPDWFHDHECCQLSLRCHGLLEMSQGWYHHVYGCHWQP